MARIEGLSRFVPCHTSAFCKRDRVCPYFMGISATLSRVSLPNQIAHAWKIIV
jgi:hypothetical protein